MIIHKSNTFLNLMRKKEVTCKQATSSQNQNCYLKLFKII